MSPERMNDFNLEKNLIITYVTQLNLSSASLLGSKIWELTLPVIRQIESFD